MEDTKFYKFIGKMSLEFRLSLDNICKLLGKEPTEELKIQVYENIINTIDGNATLEGQYKYLFFVETDKESKQASMISYAAATNYIKRYKKAIETNDEEKQQEIYKELNGTETKFKEVSKKFHNSKLTIDEIAIISKYRIKYVISRERFCDDYEIHEDNLRKREKYIESSILKDKLNTLSQYYSSFSRGSK